MASGMTPSDKDALELWLARFKRWESFSRKHTEKWHRFYKAWRCWVEERDDGLANLFLPLIFSMIETIEPRIVEAFFSTKPWVGVLPVGVEDINAAKAQEELIQFQLEERMDFLAKAVDWIKGALVYGTSIGLLTWRLERQVRTKMRQMGIPLLGSFTLPMFKPVTVRETTYDDNYFQHIDLEGFFFEPRATKVEDALYSGHLSYENWAYLKMMEGQGYYNNLDLVEKATVTEQSPVFKRLNSVGLSGDVNDQVDKAGRTYELMHCFERDKYVVICNRETVIRNGSNPYYHKRQPYIKIVDVPVPHEFYGVGEVEVNEFLQYGLNDLTNAQIDYVMQSVLGVWLLDETSKLTAEDLKLSAGKIIRTTYGQEPKLLDRPPLKPESFTLGAILERFIADATGAQDVIRGQTTRKPTTAFEVSTVQQMAEARFRLKVRLMNESGIRQVARFMAWNNQQFITRPKAIRIMGANGFEFPKFTPEMLQGNFDFIPAGVSEEPLVAKVNRRDNIMQLYGIAKDDPRWNQYELRKRVAEALDIKDVDHILKTDEQMQMEAQAQAQAQAQVQAQQAAQGQVQPNQAFPVGENVMAPPEQSMGAFTGGMISG